jgi:predicted histone-like DNA-binding protein
MEKSVAYSVVARTDFKDPNRENKLYYAQAQARGEMNIREIGHRIQQMCTVTYPDIMAVLCSLCMVMKQGLMAGEIVRLGDLGSFRIGLRSVGAKTEKEFTRANIKRARFNFHPGIDMADLLNSLNYERVPILDRKKKKE